MRRAAPDAAALPRAPVHGSAAGPGGVTLAALSWLDGHREHFRLPDDVTEAGVDHDATLKPLGELAQLSLSISRVSPPGGRVHRLARGLLEFAWEEARHGALYLEMARAEPHAAHFLEMYAPFPEAGLRHREFEAFARLMAGTRSWAATEQEPTRRLSVLRAEERLGLVTPRSSAAGEAARRTWLGGLPEPWAFESRSGYAVTHHVFHVTDWGTRPAGLPADLTEYLAHWLPAWIDTCLEGEFWDLAGELLAVASCLPTPDPPTPPGEDAEDTDAWRRYAAGQSVSGAFAEQGAVPDTAGHDTFLACYHPTLVAAFASALAAVRAPGAAAPLCGPAAGGAP